MHSNGEARARRRELEFKIIAFSLFAVGFPIGIYIGANMAKGGWTFVDQWPPAVALGILAVYLLALAVGTWRLQRVTDEVFKSQISKSGVAAAAVMLNGYPIWFLLWKAALVPEPIHWVMFLVFLLTYLGASIYYRYR